MDNSGIKMDKRIVVKIAYNVRVLGEEADKDAETSIKHPKQQIKNKL